MKTLTLPGSKSITNRDLILASLNEGKTILDGVLVSDDTRFMINALKDLGIEIEDNGTKVIVNGGKEKLNCGEIEIYLGQSGTCMRFLPALACLLQSGKVIFTGEERLMERPLGALIDGIKQMGVDIEAREDKFPPVIIKAKKKSTGGFNPLIKMDGTISSQFFTALMNIGAFVKGGLEIEVIGDLVSKPYIDMTIFELYKFGIEVENENYKKFVIKEMFQRNIATEESRDVSLKHLNSQNTKQITIEGDASALSYIANYIVLHGGRIEITNLGKNTKQGDYKYLDVLQKYFGLIWESNGEKTILKCGGLEKNSPLLQRRGARGEVINFEDMPDISMSFMSLAIFLPGKTKITGLKTLNLKECKRIDAMRDELRKLGVEVKSDEKSIIIGEYNGKKSTFFSKIKIETYNDHRIAMTFGVLKTYLEKKFNEKIKILNPDCVAKTYPNFWEDLKQWLEIEDLLEV